MYVNFHSFRFQEREDALSSVYILNPFFCEDSEFEPVDCVEPEALILLEEEEEQSRYWTHRSFENIIL